MSTKREGKFVRVLKTYSCDYWIEYERNNVWRGSVRHEMGPVLPMYRCLKFKWMQSGKGNPGLSLKLQWDVTPNDPRFAAIKAITDLTPNRASLNSPNYRFKDQWEFEMDEYRSIAGREGEIK